MKSSLKGGKGDIGAVTPDGAVVQLNQLEKAVGSVRDLRGARCLAS